MDANIVHVDLSVVDADIAKLQQEIDKLTKTLEIRVGVKEYLIQSGNVNSGQINNVTHKQNNSESDHDIKTSITDNSSSSNTDQFKIGVSEFIVKFLTENSQADTKTITQSYAVALSEKYLSVRNNVANALTRLKKRNKIQSKKIEGSPGSIYSLYKNNRAELALQ